MPDQSTSFRSPTFRALQLGFILFINYAPSRNNNPLGEVVVLGKDRLEKAGQLALQHGLPLALAIVLNVLVE